MVTEPTPRRGAESVRGLSAAPADDATAVAVSRRRLLGAVPVVALVAGACGTRGSSEPGGSGLGPPPDPGTPAEAIQVLLDGNARFAARTPQIRDVAEIEARWGEVTVGQRPFAMVLGCADSRLAPELIFDQFVGDIFVVREAGNIAVSPTSLGSLEYGQAVLKSKALMVMGHSDCGAVKAAYDAATPGGNIAAIIDAIRPGIAGAPSLDEAIARNVRAVIATIRSNSPLLREAERTGVFSIRGAFYDIASATVRVLDS